MWIALRRDSLCVGACVAACLLVACGADEPDDLDAVDVMLTTGALLPWKEGNSWTYRVIENGEEALKVTTVGPLERVGGTGPASDKMANRTVTKKGERDQTISWQAVEDGRVVRYREQSFAASTGLVELEEHWQPSKLHVDGNAAHIAEGVSWLEPYIETKAPLVGEVVTKEVRDAWTVEVADEVVTVPAGTFHAIVLQKAGGSSLKTYWYVPGIGKVKEIGAQTEELTAYTIVP